MKYLSMFFVWVALGISFYSLHEVNKKIETVDQKTCTEKEAMDLLCQDPVFKKSIEASRISMIYRCQDLTTASAPVLTLKQKQFIASWRYSLDQEVMKKLQQTYPKEMEKVQ